MTEIRPPKRRASDPQWLLELADVAPESFWPARTILNWRIQKFRWPTRREVLHRVRGYGFIETVVLDAALEQMHELYLESGGRQGCEMFTFEKRNSRGPITRYYGLDPWWSKVVPNEELMAGIRARYGPNTDATIPEGIFALPNGRWHWLFEDRWDRHFLSGSDLASIHARQMMSPGASSDWRDVPVTGWRLGRSAVNRVWLNKGVVQ